MTAVFGTLFLYSVAAAVWWPDAAHWPVRVAGGIAVIVFLTVLLRSNRRSLLASPLTVLGCWALAFYSLIPSAVLFFGLPYPALKPATLAQAGRYLGDSSELIVLAFSTACLAIVAAMNLLPHRFALSRDTCRQNPGSADRVMLLSGLVLVLASLALFTLRLSGSIPGNVPHELLRQLKDAMVPVISFACIALIWHAVGRSPARSMTALILILFGGAALMSGIAVKQLFFALTGCLLCYVIVRRVTWKRVIFVIVSMPVIAAVGILLLVFVRGNTAPPDAAAPSTDWARFAGRAIFDKAAVRQIETIGCFQRAVSTHLAEPPGQSPFYFLGILRPRVIWPEKPNYSEGGDHGLRFCNIRPEHIDPRVPQSYSITLLGEPIVKSGITGLIVAAVTALVSLTLLTVFCLGVHPVGIILMAGALPWLIDFDQSFALYIGNAVKVVLVQLPLAAALHWARRCSVGPGAPAAGGA